jgi:hypothetical protein
MMLVANVNMGCEVMNRHRSVWPLTPLGTIVLIPLGMVLVWYGNIAFWWVVLNLGEFMVRHWSSVSTASHVHRW